MADTVVVMYAGRIIEKTVRDITALSILIPGLMKSRPGGHNRQRTDCTALRDRCLIQLICQIIVIFIIDVTRL